MKFTKCFTHSACEGNSIDYMDMTPDQRFIASFMTYSTKMNFFDIDTGKFVQDIDIGEDVHGLAFFTLGKKYVSVYMICTTPSMMKVYKLYNYDNKHEHRRDVKILPELKSCFPISKKAPFDIHNGQIPGDLCFATSKLFAYYHEEDSCIYIIDLLPQSPQYFFEAEHRLKIITEFEETSRRERARILQSRWRALSPGEKAKYETLSEESAYVDMIPLNRNDKVCSLAFTNNIIHYCLTDGKLYRAVISMTGFQPPVVKQDVVIDRTDCNNRVHHLSIYDKGKHLKLSYVLVQVIGDENEKTIIYKYKDDKQMVEHFRLDHECSSGHSAGSLYIALDRDIYNLRTKKSVGKIPFPQCEDYNEVTTMSGIHGQYAFVFTDYKDRDYINVYKVQMNTKGKGKKKVEAKVEAQADEAEEAEDADEAEVTKEEEKADSDWYDYISEGEEEVEAQAEVEEEKVETKEEAETQAEEADEEEVEEEVEAQADEAEEEKEEKEQTDKTDYSQVYTISKQLREFIDPMHSTLSPSLLYSIPFITKKLTNYIRANNLEDQHTKKIKLDDILKNILMYNPELDEPLTIKNLPKFLKHHFNLYLITTDGKAVSCSVPHDSNKPVADAPKPISEPVAEVPKPVADVSKPVADVSKPVADVSKPVADTPKQIVVDNAPSETSQSPNNLIKIYDSLCAEALKKTDNPLIRSIIQGEFDKLRKSS